jgi:hypothetical protein
MQLEKLRELQLQAAPQPGRPLHLSAASGLLRVGATFYVVADDELHLGAFPVAGAAPGTLIRMLEGELPDTKEDRKKHKPDLEALTLLPAFAGYPHGAMLALGSGSKQWRRRAVLLALDHDGVAAAARVLDFSRVFAAVEQEVDDLNVEGAVVIAERLWLMHRANKSHCDNCLVSFSLPALLESIGHDDVLGTVPILAVRRYNLGAIDSVPLCFTDGAALPDGRLVFAAVAEDTEDSYADGPCRGAAIGVIGTDGKLQSMHYLNEPYKVEGIHAVAAGSQVRVWLVTDADDARVPALLVTGEFCQCELRQ